MESVHTVTLDSSWSWKQRNESVTSVHDELDAPSIASSEDTKTEVTAAWRPAQTYPTEIHVELLKADLIPDPYIGFNEHAIQCEFVIPQYQTKLNIRVDATFSKGSERLSGFISLLSPSKMQGTQSMRYLNSKDSTRFAMFTL